MPSEASTPLLALRGVTKRFAASAAPAVRDLDLSVARGEFIAILGPSGCGKTTLLRLVGGFIRQDEGSIEIEGRDVTALGPARRPVNTVFQGYGLFPHMTVRQNIGYGLHLRGQRGDAPSSAISKAVDLVRLSGLEGRLPASLSGGQQQRVALARALVMRPSLLLLDESLAALDLQLRMQMQDELRRIHRETGGTFILVTHDQGEAFALANRVAVMNQGRIEQFDAPDVLYRQPATRFVASFVGDANLWDTERRGGTVRLGPIRIESAGADGPVTVLLRPEDVSLNASDEGATPARMPRRCS